MCSILYSDYFALIRCIYWFLILTLQDGNNYEIKHFYFPSSCFNFKLLRRTTVYLRIVQCSNDFDIYVLSNIDKTSC